MSTLNGEQQVARYLRSLGLNPERFRKSQARAGKSPDFRVLTGDELAFFCEVKTAQVDEWLERRMDASQPGVIVGGLRGDPIYNRIENYVHSAARQFDAVNPKRAQPNVLAVVNHDLMAGFEDLLSVLTGYAFTDQGPFAILCKYSEGRIREQKTRIDLYLWFRRDEGEPQYFWTKANKPHYDFLCECLGVDQTTITEMEQIF